MKQVGFLGAALIASLVAAYTVWTDGGDPVDPDAVAVYRGDADDLTRIAWTSDTEETVIERRRDDHGPYLWVTVTETIEIAEATPTAEPDAEAGDEKDGVAGESGDEKDGDADEGSDDTATAPRTETRTVSFKGNDQADQVWDNFGPLYALRDLTEAAGAAAFGFDDPTATIEVVVGGSPVSLVVGGETYGSRDRYVKAGDRIFLIDDRTLRPLQYAKTRLVDRSLIPLAGPDIVALTATKGDRTATWTHEARDDRAQNYWAPQGDPDTRDEAAKTWIRKLLAVRAATFVDEDDLDVTLTPHMTYEVQGDDETWRVEVLREVTDDDDPAYYARSTWSRSLVELTKSLATDAFADVDDVLPE